MYLYIYTHTCTHKCMYANTYFCAFVHTYIYSLAQCNDEAGERGHPVTDLESKQPSLLHIDWSVGAQPRPKASALRPVPRLDLAPQLQMVNVPNILSLLMWLLCCVVSWTFQTQHSQKCFISLRSRPSPSSPLSLSLQITQVAQSPRLEAWLTS